MAGYHLRNIKRGEFGEFSKIIEEFEELLDAHDQNIKIMELCELSDLYGAMEAYIKKYYQLSMDDIQQMKNVTARAFEDETRTSK